MALLFATMKSCFFQITIVSQIKGLSDIASQKLILDRLNKRRVEELWKTRADCIPTFTWDDDLAEAAQVWADQCAMVEYNGNATSDKN